MEPIYGVWLNKFSKWYHHEWGEVFATSHWGLAEAQAIYVRTYAKAEVRIIGADGLPEDK